MLDDRSRAAESGAGRRQVEGSYDKVTRAEIEAGIVHPCTMTSPRARTTMASSSCSLTRPPSRADASLTKGLIAMVRCSVLTSPSSHAKRPKLSLPTAATHH